MNTPELQRSLAAVIPPPGTAGTLPETAALARVVAAVHQRWGAASLTVLGTPGATPRSATKRDEGRHQPERRVARDAIALPPWWPGAASRCGRPLPVTGILEVAVATGAGRLTFMLAWAAALCPDLLAIIDASACTVEDGARLYPTAVRAAGLPSTCRPIVIRPRGDTSSRHGTPRDETRAIVDALFILLRSEAFDAILCPLPSGARLTTATATTLARMAARAGTALVVMTDGRGLHGTGRRGATGSSAAYRLVIADHRWAWRDGELAGLRLEVHTHRARGGAEAQHATPGTGENRPCDAGTGATLQALPDTAVPWGVLAMHVLDFRLRRIVRDGPVNARIRPSPSDTLWELSGVATGRLGPCFADGNKATDTFLASAI